MKNLLLIIICSSNFLYSQIYTEKYISEATDVSLNWLGDLNYNKYFDKGVISGSTQDFNSFNTERLSDKSLIDLLASIGYK